MVWKVLYAHWPYEVILRTWALHGLESLIRSLPIRGKYFGHGRCMVWKVLYARCPYEVNTPDVGVAWYGKSYALAGAYEVNTPDMGVAWSGKSYALAGHTR
jgi:hypothetical protein